MRKYRYFSIIINTLTNKNVYDQCVSSFRRYLLMMNRPAASGLVLMRLFCLVLKLFFQIAFYNQNKLDSSKNTCLHMHYETSYKEADQPPRKEVFQSQSPDILDAVLS